MGIAKDLLVPLGGCSGMSKMPRLSGDVQDNRWTEHEVIDAVAELCREQEEAWSFRVLRCKASHSSMIELTGDANVSGSRESEHRVA